jgi:hypothetical protein
MSAVSTVKSAINRGHWTLQHDQQHPPAVYLHVLCEFFEQLAEPLVPLHVVTGGEFEAVTMVTQLPASTQNVLCLVADKLLPLAPGLVARLAAVLAQSSDPAAVVFVQAIMGVHNGGDVVASTADSCLDFNSESTPPLSDCPESCAGATLDEA